MAKHTHAPVGQATTTPGTGIYHERCRCGARRTVMYRGPDERDCEVTTTRWNKPGARPAPSSEPNIIELELSAMRLRELATEIRGRMRGVRDRGELQMMTGAAQCYSIVADWLMARVKDREQKGGEHE